jgi:hypothetical protein
MTTTEHRDASRNYLSSVHATHATLAKLYAKPNKSTDDWSQISELRTMISAGYDAAQVHATLSLRDAVAELVERLPRTDPGTLV